MSDTVKQKPIEPRVRDIQKRILERMLKNNPKCTAEQAGRNYENMKRYLMGEDR